MKKSERAIEIIGNSNYIMDSYKKLLRKMNSENADMQKIKAEIEALRDFSNNSVKQLNNVYKNDFLVSQAIGKGLIKA